MDALESLRTHLRFRGAADGAARHLPRRGHLPSLAGATEWLNSPPLTATELRGNVVLIDFWTYTCINWLRTLPYIREWANKYKDEGLVVIGVHAPEFPFERSVDKVRGVTMNRGIDYPVVIDNDHAVWRALNNMYWPALYLADADGSIRFHHFGEEGYEESERAIQQLLVEAGRGKVDTDLVSVLGFGDEAPPDWGALRSPETYVGYERAENFASPGGAVWNERHGYTAPRDLRLNQWALAGDWTMERGRAVLHEAGGAISFRFHARDLHLVMGPATEGASMRFQIVIDGRTPDDTHGGDVDERGNGVATERRLYQLVRQRDAISEHTFEITFLDREVEAYVFTFG
jgi:thiol-disulfide isomerase/thioredoxin